MAYEHGAFRLQSALGWAVQLAAETARRRGDASAHQALYAASRNLPLSEAVPTRPALLERLAPDSHYHAWLAHSTPDEYWARRSPCAVLGACGVPALWIGGWYDSLLDGTLRGFRDVAARRAPPQRLVIGPWAHIPWSRRVGAVDFGSAAESAIDELQVRWFDHWLKGRDTGMLAEPPIRLFEMGGSGWLALDRWPDPRDARCISPAAGSPAWSRAAAPRGRAGRGHSGRRHRPRPVAARADRRRPPGRPRRACRPRSRGCAERRADVYDPAAVTRSAPGRRRDPRALVRSRTRRAST